MTLLELETSLKSLGYPVAYYQFNVPLSFPCIIYYAKSQSTINTDDAIVVSKVTDVTIELCTQTKDVSVEEKAEKLLQDNGFSYQKSEVYLYEEKYIKTLYEIQIIE